MKDRTHSPSLQPTHHGWLRQPAQAGGWARPCVRAETRCATTVP